MHGLTEYEFPKAQAEEEKHLRGKFLASDIPATSLAVGATKMPSDTGVESQEYSDFKADPWAREDGEWHHSDFIVVAYYYVTKLFDELVLGDK